MYIDEDSRVAVIAQGYEASDTSKAAAPSNKASDLATAATWILGNERPADLESSLQTAAQELHEAIERSEIDSIEFWFSHNLAPSKNVEDELERVARAGRDILSSRYASPDIDVRAREISRRTLDSWYQSARSPILVTDSISVPATDWFHESGDGWEAVCTSVPATWLHGLYDTYGDRLFSANVRGYMPLRRTAQNINFGIEQTAKSSPKRFWAFNNGVTALVHEIQADRNGPELELGGIAVVNGAQTTGSLGRVDLKALSDVRVLIRFVKATNSELIQDIIRYNNSQNQIKPSDFRSGDRHQSRLRDEFKSIPDSLYLGARRGGPEDRARKPSNLIPSDTAAQALAAFHQEPGIAYHDLRSIWENNDVYARFFGEHTTAEHVVFCYSLWLAVAYAKSALTSTPADAQTQDIRDALEFLRKRGSLYLLVSAIAGSAEIYLSKALNDTFALSFGKKVSPADAVGYWEPLVDALLPLAPGQLSAVFGNGGLRRKEVVDSALKSFRAIVAATKRGNAELFEDFRAHLI